MIFDSIPFYFHKYNPFSYCFYYMQCCRNNLATKSIKTLSISLGCCATIIIWIIMEMSWNKMMELMRSINTIQLNTAQHNTIQTALHIKTSILSYRNMNIRFLLSHFMKWWKSLFWFFCFFFRFFCARMLLISIPFHSPS